MGCADRTEPFFPRHMLDGILHTKHIETLEKNIVETLCKLEKIFPPSFFDSMEHLPIHLAYEARVGGPVQYRWMYPFERCMMNLKRKARNKACIEGSICEAYLIQETSNFCSLYFESHVQTKLYRVPRNDDGGYVGQNNKLHIFNYPCRPYGKAIERLLDENEYKAAQRYVLLNCQEIEPFVKEFDNLMLANNPTLTDGELDKLRDFEFSKWVKTRVRQDRKVDERIRDLCNGPSKFATCYDTCFVNGFKFHTKDYGEHKTKINSGVCIKGSCYNEFEKDYYGVLTDVIQLCYVGSNTVTLFKCHWYDSEKGVKVDSKHGIVDINLKSCLKSCTKKDKGKGDWCDLRAERAATKYRDIVKKKNNVDDLVDILFDGEAWVEATGFTKNSNGYGFGLTKQADQIYKKAKTSAAKRSRTYTSRMADEAWIESEVNSRLEIRMKAFEVDMQQRVQEQVQAQVQEQVKKFFAGLQNRVPTFW